MIDMNKEEELILKYWEDNNIYEKVKKSLEGRKPFYFLDGPPYVSGELHPGQIWVKVRKDLFLRYKRFRGYDVHDRAGYDVHGLPIEHKTEELLKIKNKKEIEERIGIENFIKACKEYTSSLIQKMNRDYSRFGVWMDFKNAYVPSSKNYIESAWKILKKMNEKGFIYNEKKTIAYCPHCQTSLAQGTQEVEYKDESDPSIIVAFKVDAEASKPKANIAIDDSTYLLIWTTTPWTLPANVSVAANPGGRYVVVSSEGKKYIFAKDRLDAVAGDTGKNMIVEGEFYGSELEGIYYTSPLEEKVPEQKKLRKYHRVVMSEKLANTEEGTGLVHIAPGHGIDDYNLGKENKLPIFSPVGENAAYTEEAGVYAGITVPEEANKKILLDLKELGALLDEGSINHSYPHCWRCGSKLIYIATGQWFLKIERAKKKIIKENEKVIWHPQEAMKWEDSVLANSPDWCISRQRYWGIPLPIWKCDKCGNTAVIGSLDEMRGMLANPEEVNMLDDLHRPYVDWVVLKCSKCGGEMHRIPDVLDVWFDSGIAFAASLSEEEFNRLYPADFILEGNDQFRGWFSTLLKSSVLVYNRRPFNEVSVDGMLLAEDGREMHRHLGNYIPLHDILKKSSADSMRIWFFRHTHWLDIPFNSAEIEEARGFVMLLYNMSNLINEYGGAIGYNITKPKKPRSTEGLDAEEAWLLSRLNSVIKDVTLNLDSYNDGKALNEIIDFVTNDFSRFYLKIAKKKILYKGKKDAKKILDVINWVFYNSIIMLSVFAPFATERIYTKDYHMRESIFMEKWPKPVESMISADIEKEFEIAAEAINALLSSREKAGIKLRWPVAKAYIEVKDDTSYSALQKLTPVIEELVNAKALELKMVSTVDRIAKPNFAALGPKFKGDAPEIAKAIASSDPEELLKGIEGSGSYQLHTSKGIFEIGKEHFSVVELPRNEDAVLFSRGAAYVSRETSKELEEEAMLRELNRRLQLARKELGLKKADKISLYIEAEGGIGTAIEKGKKEMLKELNAKEMKRMPESPDISKELEIEGYRVKFAIKKE